MTSSSLIGRTIPPVWKVTPSSVQSAIWQHSGDGSEATFLGFEPNRVVGCAEGAVSHFQFACPLTLTAFSPAADRYVVARPGRVTAKAGSYWQTVVSARGDSLLHRQFRYSGTPTTAAFIDSSTAACKAREYSAARRSACDKVSHSPQLRYLHRLALGHDNTIWLELRPDDKGRHWLVLAPTGAPLGRLTLPPTFFLWAGTRTAIWGTEEDADGLENVVRYRIGS